MLSQRKSGHCGGLNKIVLKLFKFILQNWKETIFCVVFLCIFVMLFGSPVFMAHGLKIKVAPSFVSTFNPVHHHPLLHHDLQALLPGNPAYSISRSSCLFAVTCWKSKRRLVSGHADNHSLTFAGYHYTSKHYPVTVYF